MSSSDTESHESRIRSWILFLKHFDDLFSVITAMSTLGVINDEEDRKLVSITDDLQALHKRLGERMTNDFIPLDDIEKVEVLGISSDDTEVLGLKLLRRPLDKNKIH